ncbi:MAG TPA: hypothetical protein VI583_16375 [Cyclobacteriaceae bacterium]|nr:hypothetical protein [Cyclobacteriaceae bacterium]
MEKLKRIGEKLAASFFPDNLNILGKIYRTDKTGRHEYTRPYQAHLGRFRNRPIKLLEIGVGGYDNPKKGGKSLRMWKSFFPEAKIFSIDIHNKSGIEEERIKIFRGSQADESFIKEVISHSGFLDIIIDDGSHINEHVIRTFEILFPCLNIGGVYVIEDTQTSYWPKYGGDSHDREDPRRLMNFFKNLTDSLNHQEFLIDDYRPNYYDKNIVSIHFYHILIIIHKRLNDEPSNIRHVGKI